MKRMARPVSQAASKTARRQRTGCWTCKERRVKCNEARPACLNCERLSLPCRYGMKLLWRDEALSRGIALGRSGTRSNKGRRTLQEQQTTDSLRVFDFPCSKCHESPKSQRAYTEGWMFLNTTYQDFRFSLELVEHTDPETPDIAQALTYLESSLNLTPSSEPAFSDDRELFSICRKNFTLQGGNSSDDLMLENDDSINQSPLYLFVAQNPSPFRLGGSEVFLLDYFTNGLIPRCTTWPADNPFVRIVVPICLSAINGPLFHTVMAIASHQLYLLDDKRFERDIWTYRSRALRGFQDEVARFGTHTQSSPGWEHLVATLVMLTFFDISESSSSSWLIHQSFARKIRSLLPVSEISSAAQRDLFRFFCNYFAEHEAFARTAYDIFDPCGECVPWFSPELDIDMTVIDALLGCSPELISVISEISNLAYENMTLQILFQDICYEQEPLQERQQVMNARRTDIERRLHTLQQQLPSSLPTAILFDGDGQNVTEELGFIAETRRLSALVYMYSRLDGIPPGLPPISRLTDQILTLIPKISLRTHALLWPLFVVGTMGIGVCNPVSGDADRTFVLERLVSLQRTRQLRHVSRTREIVEAVWRIRDLEGPKPLGGWQDLAQVESYGVSLC